MVNKRVAILLHDQLCQLFARPAVSSECWFLTRNLMLLIGEQDFSAEVKMLARYTFHVTVKSLTKKCLL
jgi:hypothetical protein